MMPDKSASGFDKIYDYKGYKASSEEKKEVNYLKKIDSNISELAKNKDKESPCKLHFMNKTGEIKLDESYLLTRGVRGFMPGSAYHQNLPSLAKFIEFSSKYFKAVSLPPGDSQKMLSQLQAAKEGLAKLDDQYYGNDKKPDRHEIIEKVKVGIDGMMTDIAANTRQKFDAPNAYITDKITAYLNAENLHELIFRELDGELGVADQLLKLDDFVPPLVAGDQDLRISNLLYESISQPSNAKMAEESEEDQKLPTIADFKAVIAHFPADLNKDQKLKNNLLSEFLILPKEKRDVVATLTETVGVINGLSLSVKEKTKLKTAALRQAFPQSFAQKLQKKADMQVSIQLARIKQEQASKGRMQVAKGVGAAGLGAGLQALGTLTGVSVFGTVGGKVTNYGVDQLKEFFSKPTEETEELKKQLTELQKNPQFLSQGPQGPKGGRGEGSVSADEVKELNKTIQALITLIESAQQGGRPRHLQIE